MSQTLMKSCNISTVETAIAASIGVMAYNEEANIGRLLQRLLEQRSSRCRIEEIIVVASGCTDSTEPIVRQRAESDPRIRLLTQTRREGKASAINLFLHHANCDILVLESADTLPEPGTIECLLEPFVDPEVGMTGAHPVPVNDPGTLMGFTTHLMWDLHHQIALRHPKMGELVAFRRVFDRIPRNSAVDEVSIEAAVRCQGYQLRYVPAAIVYNRGPATVSDFLRQRRRIYCGHLKVREEQGYEVPTMKSTRILSHLMRSEHCDWRRVHWVLATIALEAYGRYLGYRDFRTRKRDHAIWDTASTTKGEIV